MDTAILYLHGVGQNVRTDGWYDALSRSLAAHGIEVPAKDSPQILCPDYVDLLKLQDVPEVAEPPLVRFPTVDDADRLAVVTAYKHRQVRLTSELEGVSTLESGRGLGPRLDPAKVPMPADLNDVHHYVTSAAVRTAILDRVIAAIGETREVVIVAHSLGSVVAIELVHHLPPTVHVRGLVTLGSPAGLVGFHTSNAERLGRDFPYTRVDTWINFLYPLDPVPRGAGLSRLFPAALDVPIDVTILHPHSVVTYLGHPAVSRVLADLVSGAEPGAPVPPGEEGEPEDVETEGWDPAERLALDALVFTQRTSGALRAGDVATRHETARRAVARDVARRLSDARAATGRSVPAVLDQMAATGECPTGFSATQVDERLAVVVVAATSNLIAPYDMDVQVAAHRTVPWVWSHDAGFARDDGLVVVEAIRSAMSAFRPLGWVPPVVETAGLTLLAAGPVEFADRASLGWPDHAEFVQRLGTTGPGAAALAVAALRGTVGLAEPLLTGDSLASGAVPVEALRTHVVRAMAHSRALLALGFSRHAGPAPSVLAEWRERLTDRADELGPLSDPGSGTMRLVQAKVKVVEQALAWFASDAASGT